MSRRALEANTLLSFRQINQSSLNFDGSVSASNEKVVCRNVCFKRLISKIPSEKKKGLIGLQESYQDQLVLFNVHMYDEFHVPDVLIVLLYM